MRTPVSKRRHLSTRWSGSHNVIGLLAVTAVLLCLYLLRRPAAHNGGSTPMLLRRLGHSTAGVAAEDEAHAQSAAAVQSTVDSGVGGIFFGEGVVGVHEEAKDPERVFGLGTADDVLGKVGKVRPLGFYFHKDIPKDLKHLSAKRLAPGETGSGGGGGGGSNLEHLQAVAKHKASKGAAGDAALGFYFAKDIPDDVKAKSNDRRLSWMHWPAWLGHLR